MAESIKISKIRNVNNLLRGSGQPGLPDAEQHWKNPKFRQQKVLLSVRLRNLERTLQVGTHLLAVSEICATMKALFGEDQIESMW